MKRTGPLLTVLAGVVTAAVLIVLNVVASDDQGQQSASAAGAVEPTAPATAPEPTAPAPPPPPAKAPNATYAARFDGGGGAVAIAVRDGKVIAYVCDGKKVESWLNGDALLDQAAGAGDLVLVGAKGSQLNATFVNGVAKGSVAAGGKKWTFTARTVKAPSGLYRFAGNVRNAQVAGSWIVLANGSQVGVLITDDKPAPAPELNTSSRTATVDGASLTATPVDGETGSGF